MLLTPKVQLVSIFDKSKSLNLDLAILRSFNDKSKPTTFAEVSKRAPIECLPSPHPMSKRN